MKISDVFNSEALIRLAQKTIKVGDVYLINLNRSNGITPKPGDTSRDKFFVVLGFDSNGVAYGGVVVNSGINPNLPQWIKDFHMPLAKSKYSFLHYDSYVNCANLMETNLDKFANWKYLGEIEPYDLKLIIGTVMESPAISKAKLKQFGLVSQDA